MKLSAKAQALTDLIEPAVAACDVALWGVEFRPQGKRSLLRVYIDVPESKKIQHDVGGDTVKRSNKPESVGVDDCKRVSHQVSGLLDVHDPIDGEFVLEVSSPGWDRTFFKLEQMQQYIGQHIALRLITAVENRRKFTGQLLSVSDNSIDIKLLDNESTVTLIASNIDKANLVFEE